MPDTWQSLCESVAARWPEARPFAREGGRAALDTYYKEDGSWGSCNWSKRVTSYEAAAHWFRSLMEAAARRGYAITFDYPPMTGTYAAYYLDSREYDVCSLTALARLCLALAEKEPPQ